MTVIDRIDEAETALFEGLAGLHEKVIDAHKTVAQGLDEIRPEGFELPEMPEPAIAPAVAVNRSFDFAAKVLEANRSFVEQIVATWSPVAPAKPAAKAASKK